MSSTLYSELELMAFYELAFCELEPMTHYELAFCKLKFLTYLSSLHPTSNS